MKGNDYTFVLLPQKTSLYIGSQVNRLKKVTHSKNVLKLKHIQVLSPINLIGEILSKIILGFKLRKLSSYHSFFKPSR